MSNTIIPTTVSLLLVSTATQRQTLQLPAASTVPGQLLMIKTLDFLNSSNYYVSATRIYTTGLDTLDTIYNGSTGQSFYGILSSPSACLTLASDGILNWMVLGVTQPGFPYRFQNISTAFAYTGLNQTFVVPVNVTQIKVYLWGAGGSGIDANGGAARGGAGAMVQGILPVAAGQSLTIIVGGGGTVNSGTTFGGGGAGGPSGAGTAGQGGGRSAIQTSSIDRVTAGGGGGGGYASGGGGAATFSWTATAGETGVYGEGGGGGSQSSGGTSGGPIPGTAGSRYLGGNGGIGWGYGGGGGGGYYGGGGGSGSVADIPFGGGGGGGSSYTSLLSVIPGDVVFGFNSSDGSAAPNTTSPYYTAGVAQGGSSSSAAGGNGRIVIVY